MANRSVLLLFGLVGCLPLACSSTAEPEDPIAQSGTGGNAGGASSNTGGASSNTGGASPNTGGASSNTGGASSNTGGASSNTSPNTGGASSNTGGASSNTGGSLSTSGGNGGTALAGGAGGSAGSVSSTGGQPSDGGQGQGGEAGSSGVTGGSPRRLLLCDEGNRRVLRLDLESPSNVVWSTLVNDPDRHGDSVRDLQLVGGDRIAASTAKGYIELDINTGEITKEVSSFVGVESLRRLPNGNTILGANADGGVTLQELDSQDVPVDGRRVTFTDYEQLRLLRRTPQDTFLMGAGARLVEVNWEGQTLWEMSIPDGDWVYQGLRLPDNTIAVTSGYGAAIVVIDPATKTVLKTIGGQGQPDAATIVPSFYAGFQVLPNGHFVVTNWEGHGGGHGETGLQLLEYDPSGLLVWQWQQDPELVSSLHNVIVLDGLDTTKLHDDVNGVLAPVE